MFTWMKNFLDFSLEFVRRLVRPATTAYLLFLFGFSITHTAVDETRMMAVSWLTAAVVVFWFGERVFVALGLNVNDLILRMAKKD